MSSSEDIPFVNFPGEGQVRGVPGPARQSSTETARLAADLAAALRQNADLQVANNRLLQRARDAEERPSVGIRSIVPDELRRLSEDADDPTWFTAWGSSPGQAEHNSRFGKAAMAWVRQMLTADSRSDARVETDIRRRRTFGASDR